MTAACRHVERGAGSLSRQVEMKPSKDVAYRLRSGITRSMAEKVPGLSVQG